MTNDHLRILLSNPSHFQWLFRAACVAHVLQALTEADPNATALSIDAHQCIRSHLPYDRQSTYFWEDDSGTVHHIVQGEGGEQGDPLMPLSFALGDGGTRDQGAWNSVGT